MTNLAPVEEEEETAAVPHLHIPKNNDLLNVNTHGDNRDSNHNDAAEPSKRLFDTFCDYTSISGFRFLHSRYPGWFRALSAVVLFGSIGMFIYHSSIYVRRLNDKRNSIQMYTTKVANLSVPYIVVCPLRQFKFADKKSIFLTHNRSILHSEGPPDLAHIVSHHFTVPNQLPEVDGVPVLKATEAALLSARKFSAQLASANGINAEQMVLEAAQRFSGNKTYQKLFPQCALLMKLSSALNLARDRPSIYRNYSNYREWQLHMNDTCFTEIINTDASLQRPNSLLQLAKCRANIVVGLLEQILDKLRNFGDYVRRARPPLEEYVPFCRWLDGGPCLLDWVSSEIGVFCVKVGSKRHALATYISLRNSIDIVLDLFAFDNQVSTWDERELRILLKAENLSSVCTGIDGFV